MENITAKPENIPPIQVILYRILNHRLLVFGFTSARFPANKTVNTKKEIIEVRKKLKIVIVVC